MQHNNDITSIPKRRRTLKLIVLGLGLMIFIAHPTLTNATRLGQAENITYYISPNGSNDNDGLTPQTAWQTIAYVNSKTLAHGTTLLFEGGQAFYGSLAINPDDCAAGPADAPIIIGSYGSDKAAINAGNEDGITVYNCDFIEISNLMLLGNGASNKGDGIFFYTDLPGNIKLDHIVINHIEASGFQHGIRVGSWNGMTGFRDVTLTHNEVYNNIRGGINVFGIYDDTLQGSHEDVTIAYNIAHHNLGDVADITHHSGNGIVVGGVMDTVIEHNVAYENGGLNPNIGSGPVGIWAYDCNRVTIQFNESYDNHTGPNAVDGGGFDLDQGCSNSVMQYNYSHNNDGAGFLIWQNNGAQPMSNNVVRYNISENDGRRGDYGGITVGGFDPITDIFIYNNTIYITPSAKGNGKEGGIAVWGANHQRIKVYNNILMTSGDLPLVTVERASSDVAFLGNNYFSDAGMFTIYDAGSTYHDLAAWRSSELQEMLADTETGSALDPMFVNSGNGQAEGDSAYRLQIDSPMIDSGLDLETLFGIESGGQDYFGTNLPQGEAYDLGAHELISFSDTLFIPFLIAQQ